MGTATPAALLETWLWALRTGDAEGLQKVWDYPSETPETEKAREIERVQAAVIARQKRVEVGEPSTGRPFEDHRLIEMLPLGEDKYLALVETRLPATGTHVMKKVFRRVESEWKVFAGPPTYSPTGN